MISQQTTIEELNKLGLVTVRTMNVCRNGRIYTIGQLLMMSRTQLLYVRGCGKLTLEEIENIKIKFSNLLENAIKNDEQEPQQTDRGEDKSISVSNAVINDMLLDAQKRFDLLSPSKSGEFKRWIEWRFSKLSVRTKKIFPNAHNITFVLKVLYSGKAFNALSESGCGRKTALELDAYLEDIKLRFEKLIANVDIDSDPIVISDTERLIEELEHEYPFLLTKECESIINFKYANNRLPFLFIAKLYILRSNDRKAIFCRDYYGLNSTFIRYNLNVIGEKNNLCRERVRQIVNKALPLPKGLQKEVLNYLKLNVPNIICFEDLIWNKIQEENMLEESYSQTALLTCALLGTHTIIKIDDDDKEYLVKKTIIENVKIRNVINNIKRIIELRRTIIERLDILKFIKSDCRKYHKNVSELCRIYADFIKRKYGYEIEEGRYIVMMPTALDIPAAIENILEQKGEPMTQDELMLAFNKIHPHYYVDNLLKFKSYLSRSRNIVPKGKTGIYVLQKWKNHFTGTLTDFLIYILESFNELIPFDDLVDFALEEFPHTNRKSIYTLVAGDCSERFIIYEGDLVGLASKRTFNLSLKERKVINRCSFDDRFETFKAFVFAHKRLPIQTGTNEEQSLARWMINVIKSNIDVSEEQHLSLQSFLRENSDIPQNGTEYNFKQMCDTIKVMVHKTFQLPSVLQNPKEYYWLRKNRKKALSYSDNRKAYFEDLLAYLRDFGFYL